MLVKFVVAKTLKMNRYARRYAIGGETARGYGTVSQDVSDYSILG